MRETAAIGWRALALVGAIVAAGVLATAGVTTTVLSPRWLGGLLLGLTVVALVAAAVEVRALTRLTSMRRQRLHEQELRRQLS